MIWLDRYITVSHPARLNLSCFLHNSCHVFIDLLTLATSRKYVGNEKLERFVPVATMSLKIIRDRSGEREPFINLIHSLICSSRHAAITYMRNKMFVLLRPIPKITNDKGEVPVFWDGVQRGVDIRGSAWACMWAQPSEPAVTPRRVFSTLTAQECSRGFPLASDSFWHWCFSKTQWDYGTFPKHYKTHRVKQDSTLRCPVASTELLFLFAVVFLSLPPK